MPDATRFLAVLQAHQRRFRLAALAAAGVVASALTGAVLAVLWLLGANAAEARVMSVTLLFTVGVLTGVWWWRGWTTTRVAAEVESRTGTAHNIIVTAHEVASGYIKPPHPVVRAELFEAAVARLEDAPLERVEPLWGPTAMAVCMLIAVLAAIATVPGPVVVIREAGAPPAGASIALAPGDLRIVVTPPAYAARQPLALLNPTTMTALEGSRIRLETARAASRVELRDAAAHSTAFTAEVNGFSLEFVATDSQPLLIRHEDAGGIADRLVYLRVERDRQPVVRIQQPARDLIFAEAKGQVSIEVEAIDEVGLTSLVLTYTRVSGSGEALTFQEGQWPVQVERLSAGRWNGRASIALDALSLQEGDSLVYRAMARDARPGGEPSASDPFLIEIGRLAGVASTGFALPEDRNRQGISQQMLIIKTERLHANKATLDAATFADQVQLLAVEQRMVKTEFVFMTGGEVEDEVEEATHAHELAEGRLENTAQIELLSAIREMSRAEARLNAADTAEALQFERAALRSLQRAFDRRRYLLRTLPERARIDPSRRLSGEAGDARSSARSREPSRADPTVDRARQILRDLATVTARGNVSLLASQIIALDPSSEALQKVALQFSTARGEQTRREAALDVERVVLDAIRQRLSPGSSTGLTRDSLRGHVAEELPRVSGGQR